MEASNAGIVQELLPSSTALLDKILPSRKRPSYLVMIVKKRTMTLNLKAEMIRVSFDKTVRYIASTQSTMGRGALYERMSFYLIVSIRQF